MLFIVTDQVSAEGQQNENGKGIASVDPYVFQ